jgi:YbbR domain-containing protein
MKLPGWLILDWERKLAALVFAVMIMYSVRLQNSEEKTYTLPVIIVPGEQLVLADEENLPRINVKIRGSQRDHNALKPDELRIIYKIPPTARSGRYEVQLRPRDVDMPRRLQVTDITPDSFPIILTGVLTREEVDIRLRMTPPKSPNLRPKTTVLSPRKVTISGPRSHVEAVSEILTEQLSLEDLGQQMEFDQEVKLMPIPRVTITPDRIRVHVELARVRAEKAFIKLPLQVLSDNAGGLRVASFVEPTAPLVDANIEGPAEVLDFLTPASVRAFIDLSELPGAGTYQLPVNLWINAHNCTPQSSSPRLVTVKVVRQQVSPPAKP